MFECVKIGKRDMHGNDIHEGNKLKFKCTYCGNRFIEGTVKYKDEICSFVIDRGDEGHFRFDADINNIEIIN